MPRSSADTLSDPPAADVIEVSIFGPGKGESVVVHLGHNRWIVVDSCKDQRVRRQARTVSPLSYLDRIGVDCSKAVELVVATHAHDDHFAGIAEVFRKCESAKFVCSRAITKEEFAALTLVYRQVLSELLPRAYSEYRRVFQIIKERSGPGPGFRPMKYAYEKRQLLDDDGRNGASVISLSPSDEAVSRSLEALASAMPSPGNTRKAILADPNELAVALWVEVSGKAMILGADLPRGPDGCGWVAVLASFVPPLKASLFKIPHHGSVTGHHEDVWSDLLEDSPIAVLAPFRGGDVRLPEPSDAARILSFTPDAFITALPEVPAASAAVRKEAAALGPLASQVREVWGKVGHVRARSRIGEVTWDVDLATPAVRLT
jgi:hypothetical protein